jgi:hypothetical protein
MSKANHPLTRFVFTPRLDWWEAELLVPMWGGQLPVQIAAPATGPSDRQVETLRAILRHPGDLRGIVAEALLGLYRDEWGDVTRSLVQAPELRSADEVWTAMSRFALYIPAFESAAGGVVFEVHMESHWDVDHGLCVLIQDWSVVRVAGQTDCRGDRL